MGTETLAGALEREHEQIDAGIAAFTAADADGPASLTTALAALRRHIYLEEQFLFPPLRTGGLMAAIFVMLREHGEMWQVMDRIDAALATDPGDPAVLRLCADLVPLLESHNTKEESIVYTQADSALGAPATAELMTFIESGRLPDGWVCAKS